MVEEFGFLATREGKRVSTQRAQGLDVFIVTDKDDAFLHSSYSGLPWNKHTEI